MALWRSRNQDGVPVDAIEPGIGGRADLIAAKRLPNGAVALDAGAESNLPHDVVLAHAVLCLHVRKLVPDGAGGCVAEPVERHPSGLHVVLRQLQILLDPVQDRLTARVNAEVLDHRLEVGGVGWVVHVQHLPRHEIGGEFQLLRDGQNFRCKGGDVAP